MEINYKKTLLASGALFWTRQNLELVLGRNRRTLDDRIQSLSKDNLLTPLKSGLYLNTASYEKSTQPEEVLKYLSGILVEPSYISLEYVLAEAGILAESVYTLTCITTQKTRKFETPVGAFSYRSLKPILFFGYETKTFGSLSYRIATPEKALFDYLYLTPWRSVREMKALLFDSRFNWDKIDKSTLTAIITKSNSAKMNKILKLL